MTPLVGPGRFVGASVQRREDPRLLTGHGHYVDDVVLPGMLHAAFLRSPIARGEIVGLDIEAATAASGVVAVFTGEDLRDDAATLWNYGSEDHPFPPVPALAVGDVRFVGDPIAIVIAESRYLAEDACELIEVDYEARTPVIGRRPATADTEIVHPEVGTNIAWSMSGKSPAVEDALAACEHVVTETIHQSRHVNVPMEGRGLVAHWEPAEAHLTVYASSQNPHQDRSFLSALLGIPEHQVRVTMRDVGGGFGQKISVTREETAVVMASHRLCLPVKWIEDRVENLIAANSARDEEMTVTLGFDADGTLHAARMDYLGDVGCYPQLPPGILAIIGSGAFPGPYRFQHFDWSGRTVFTNTCGLAAYRGPWMMETTGREITMDIAARQLGIDPAELRRRNTLHEDELPYTTATGAVYERLSPRQTLEAALEEIDYAGFRARQAQLREAGRYLGIGISHYVEPTGGGDVGPTATEVATIRVEPSGKVQLYMGTGSHGHSLETTMVQVVAEHLGVPIEDVVLHQGDTQTSPYGGGTVGSRSAVKAGAAARLSAIQVREKVVAIAAHLMEAAPEDLELTDGVITVKGSPEGRMTLGQVATAAYYAPHNLPDGMESGLENTSRFAPNGPTHANSTQICTCEVNIETGQVTLLEFVIGEDCGVMINPMVVEGQIAGGIAQGIGGALLEHLPYNDDGTPLAITFKDYLMPTADIVPDFRYVHVETPSMTPGGHKGVGEGGAIGAPAAVVNAVADALAPFGARVTTQPLNPDRILTMIDAGRGQTRRDEAAEA
jgi:carbon-monoxide dehydrogenase large subunit